MRELLQPAGETLSLAMSSEWPLAALQAALDNIHIHGKIPLTQWIEMHEKGETEKLFVLCLPSMIASISRYLGYGVPEEEILAVGLFSTFEVVNNWDPVEEPIGQGNYLRSRVHRQAGQSVQRLIAEEHGLKEEGGFPVVEAFRTCLENHLNRTGRKPTMAEMVEAVEEALPGYRFRFKRGPSQKEKAPHKVEIIYRRC